MITFEERMLLYLDTEVEPFIQESSYRSYLLSVRSLVFPVLGQIPVRELTVTIMNRFFVNLAKTKSRNTAENCYSLVKRFLRYLYQKREIDEDLASFMVFPREQRVTLKESNGGRTKYYFTPDDLLKLYRCYHIGLPWISRLNADWFPLIIFQLETFLRAGEALSLKVSQIDFTEHYIIVQNSMGRRYSGEKSERYLKVPKNGHTRVVPLSNIAEDAARRMILFKGQEFLFPNSNGELRSIDSYERAFRIILDALGINRDVGKTDCLGRNYGLNTHALRHTAITMANSVEGANLVNTALMAGHSVKYLGGADIGAESTYIHAVLSELRKVKTPSQVMELYKQFDEWDKKKK